MITLRKQHVSKNYLNKAALQNNSLDASSLRPHSPRCKHNDLGDFILNFVQQWQQTIVIAHGKNQVFANIKLSNPFDMAEVQNTINTKSAAYCKLGSLALSAML
jgi:hypothetical protein